MFLSPRPPLPHQTIPPFRVFWQCLGRPIPPSRPTNDNPIIRDVAKGEQNGFYDIHGVPRDNLIQAVTDINHQVYTNASHPGTPRELGALRETLVDTWSRYLRDPAPQTM